MKYEELIGKLRGCEDYRCDDCELGREELCNPILMEKAADAIEELQSQLPKWIPVSERLPEEKENVLCLCWGNRVRILYFDGEVWVGFGAYIKSFVTHWMHIPEPPKEETDG